MPTSYYDAYYGRFGETLYAEIRREVFGEDIGQNSWHTADEQDRFISWLGVGAGSRLLDVACGSGGPALRIAERTAAAVHGVDILAEAIETARRQAADRGLADRATFEVVDAAPGLPLPDASFEAVMCIDAINHLPDRAAVLAEWRRVLRPGGRLLFTDPIVVTGPLTNEEIAIRSSIGFFLFVSPDTDDRLLHEAGFAVERREDVTQNMATVAVRWHAARVTREADLRRVEGDEKFAAQQRFLDVAGRIAAERRLSRLVYVATRA